jgi:hypothetical protein
MAEGYHSPKLGLPLMAVGTCLLLIWYIALRYKVPSRFDWLFTRVGISSAALLAVCAGCVVTATTYLDYRKSVDAYHSPRAKNVQGNIQNYQTSADGEIATLTIGKETFSYRPSTSATGLNDAAPDLPPMVNGDFAKVLSAGDEILRLEICRSPEQR